MLTIHRKSTAGGYSLIEVLVAMVVLSLSILGFSALQITGLTSNKIAMERTQASMQAYAIADAMRANNNNLASYAHTMGSAQPTGTDTASTDVKNWLTAVAKQLPSGDGSITINTTTNQVTVVVQWSENKSASTSNFTLNTRL